VNLIPLNPTTGYAGGPSADVRIKQFVAILESYGIAATVRVRRGIDIDAGCGQLKAAVLKRERKTNLETVKE
jgi:23S rRNA (adenine2503-C2)-methyltransferase